MATSKKSDKRSQKKDKKFGTLKKVSAKSMFTVNAAALIMLIR